MNNFQVKLKAELSSSRTENGAKCYTGSDSDLYNYFINIATYRNADEAVIREAFKKAYQENSKYTAKALFYGRDIRNGGLGERDFFRKSFLELEMQDAIHAQILIDYISEFGRWDDVVFLALNSKTEMVSKKALDMIYNQLKADYFGECPSLLAKWMPSINTSSRETRNNARRISKMLAYESDRDYRKAISAIRKKINVLETELCQSLSWENIDLSKIPQKAFAKYKNALWKKIPDRMTAFLEKVEKGEIEMKADILYPYDIITSHMSCGYSVDDNTWRLADAQWKALPDKYLSGDNDMIIIGDSSGSMTLDNSKPMRTMLGLAIYFAERNKGIWHNKFITFSESPSLVELKGESLKEKIECVPNIVENTDVDKVFRLLYDTAKSTDSNVPDLCFITDMQFDQGTVNPNKKTIFEKWKAKFEKKGMRFPNVVFWNVGSYSMSFQNASDVEGLQYANGYGISVFKQVIEGIGMTQYDAMIKTLDRKEYSAIE